MYTKCFVCAYTDLFYMTVYLYLFLCVIFITCFFFSFLQELNRKPVTFLAARGPDGATHGPQERICRYSYSLLLEFVSLSICFKTVRRGQPFEHYLRRILSFRVALTAT